MELAPSFPTPAPVATKADVRAFFDDLAADPVDRHGPAGALRTYRLEVLDRYAQFASSDVVLDLGCGDGRHLRDLAPRIDRGIGIDLSPRMIDVARRRAAHPSLTFRVGDAERLESIPTSTIDKVMCVGMLEHVLHPSRVFRQAARVLKPNGRFVALTLNGTYWWYRLADRVGLPTRHLATDRRFRPHQVRQLLRESRLHPDVGFWRFVPSGDLPRPLSLVCRGLDALGRRLASASLQGGLRLVGRPR